MSQNNFCQLTAEIQRYVHPDGREQLRETSLRLNPGISCLLGISGSGKTTVLRVLLGLAPGRFRGNVRFLSDGLALEPLEARRRALFGAMFQRNTLVPWLSVKRNLLLPSLLNRTLSPPLTSAVDEVVLSLGLPLATLDKFPATLSAGMLQRVAFARAVLYRPRVLLLDEPFAGLDSASADALRDSLMAYVKSDGAPVCLAVTHDVDRALDLSATILYLSSGKIDSINSPDRRQLLVRFHQDLEHSVTSA